MKHGIGFKKETSEKLPFKYFEQLLPGAQVYHSVYYPCHAGSDGNIQWCEADGLLIYDDHIFIIEVKAGAFTYTSPADDFPAYIESIKNLVLKPATQGKRFIDYLRSEEKVILYDKDHNPIGELSSKSFRHITICAVTLDPFTELAAQVQHLKKIGIDVGEHPVWSISLDDLRVYSDIFDNPLIFLHFVEQRMRAFASDTIRLDDELDHLGLYIKHNNYAQYARDIAVGSDDLDFVGYHSDIDNFFTEKLYDPDAPCPLRQAMPARLTEIVEYLSISGNTGRSKAASYLLDIGGDWRNNITASVDSVLSWQPSHMRPRPLSTRGDVKLTIFCWQGTSVPRNQELALEHTRAVMLVTGESERLLLELSYTDQGKLQDVSWQSVTLSGLSDEELQRLQGNADALRGKRLDKARSSSGKVGRNDPCPCGSGKKYKKCCLDSRL